MWQKMPTKVKIIYSKVKSVEKRQVFGKIYVITIIVNSKDNNFTQGR